MIKQSNIEALRERPDAAVWQALQKGDKKAWEVLFFRHYADLYRYAIRFTADETGAEDHIQALFLKIWERRESLGAVKAVKTYLWTALRRSLLAEQKKQQKKLKELNQRETLYHQNQFSAEELRINNEQYAQSSDALKKALNQLSGRQKEILYLKFFEGMSYNEIKQIMSISYQTARNYVHEALKALKVMLETQAGPDPIPVSFSVFLFLLLII